MATVQDIVEAVILQLRQVPGYSTQTYSAPVIKKAVQDVQTMLLSRAWWPKLMKTFTVALDGVNGFITSDLTGTVSSIDDFGDIQYIWPEGVLDKIPKLPESYNPTALSGSNPLYVTEDYTVAHRPLRIVPATATGNIVIRARQTPPTPIGTADSVYIDPLLLELGAAWLYSADDATVPATVEKFKALFEERRISVFADMTGIDIPLSRGVVSTMGGWWEAS